MSKKINLEEIWLNNITKFENIESSTIWDIGKAAMLEAIKQALELAAENTRIKDKYTSVSPAEYIGKVVNKQSILDTIKQVE